MNYPWNTPPESNPERGIEICKQVIRNAVLGFLNNNEITSWDLSASEILTVKRDIVERILHVSIWQGILATLDDPSYKEWMINITNNFHWKLPQATHRWDYYLDNLHTESPFRKNDTPVTFEAFMLDVIQQSYDILVSICAPELPRTLSDYKEIEKYLMEKIWTSNRRAPLVRFFTIEKTNLRALTPGIFNCIYFSIFCQMLNMGYARTNLSS